MITDAVLQFLAAFFGTIALDVYKRQFTTIINVFLRT